VRLGLCVAIAASTWLIPPPEGLTAIGWQTLGVFVATITGFIARPLPMGPLVLLALVALSVTRTLDFKTVMGGYGNTTVWLVVAAFLIAGAVERTGFGRRIALTLVRLLGKTTLGLGYAVCAAELVLGPCVPSNTARGGGIMAPIVQSLANALGSRSTDAPERAGQFLVLTGAHANLITAAMFLTGMAANPLVSKAAGDVYGIEFGWATWALGAIVPGLVALALLPLVLYKLMPPTLKDASAARASASDDLAKMGAWTVPQIVMGAVFVLLIGLWASKGLHGLGTGLVALIGVLLLVLTGTEKWEDITGNSKAWDTLIWLGGLLAMANALRDEGVVAWFAESIQSQVAGMSAVPLAITLAVIYFYSMYAFSMLTAHISAMVAAFFAVALAAGAPPMLTVGLFAYFSCLCACTTNYSTGPVIIYFGLGYVQAPAWFRVGAVISIFHIVVWLGVGMAWWKLIGWW
jgi:DASS family divalent anion:Na+ symporter